MTIQNNLRSMLPITVLPLDNFGLGVASDFEETLNLVEPGLLDPQRGVAEIFPLWSSDREIDITQQLMSLLTRFNELDSKYKSATPYKPVAFVFMVGSMSLHAEEYLAKIGEFIAVWEKLKFKPQLRLIPIIDVSEFPGEEVLKFETIIKRLNSLYEKQPFNEHMYLVDNTNERGLRCDRRQDVREAIRIFLEGIALSHFWNDYTNSWLNVRPDSSEPSYASFSVFAFKSPQSELIKYLSRASFNELVIKAFGENGSNSDESFSSLPKVKRVQQYFPEHGVENDNALPIPQVVLPRPLGFKGKISYKKEVQQKQDEFVGTFEHWKLEKELAYHTEHNKIDKISKSILHTFEEDLITAMKERIGGEQFLADLDEFVEAAEKSLINDLDQEEIDWHMPVNLDSRDTLGPYYKQIYKLIEKIPNLWNLIIHILIAYGFFSFAVKLFDPYLRFTNDPVWNRWIIVGSVFIYLLLVIYYSWRYPAWLIKQVINSKLKPAQKKMILRQKEFFENIFNDVSIHWEHKNNINSKFKIKSLIIKILTVLTYLTQKAQKDINDFPYPEIKWEKITSSTSIFRKFLESDVDISSLSTDLYLEYIDVIKPVLNEKKDAISQAIADGDPQALEMVIRNSIQKRYSKSPALQDQNSNLSYRVRLAATGWDGVKNFPLVRFTPSDQTKESTFFCACHPGLQKQLKKDQDFNKLEKLIHLVSLTPRDRIYFFRAWYGIKSSDLI